MENKNETNSVMSLDEIDAYWDNFYRELAIEAEKNNAEAELERIEFNKLHYGDPNGYSDGSLYFDETEVDY